MSSHRIIFEIETTLDANGAPVMPASGILLMSHATSPAEAGGDGTLRVVLIPQGFVVNDESVPLDDPAQSSTMQSIPFSKWHFAGGFKLRVAVASQDQRQITITDLPEWAAPELRISSVSDPTTPPTKVPLVTTVGKEQVIGRSQRRSNVLIDDALISAMHLCIRCEELGYTVEDLKTHNGTLLNGRPLMGKQHLSHGDRLQIGDTRIEYYNVMEIIERVAPPTSDPSVVDLPPRMSSVIPRPLTRLAASLTRPQAASEPRTTAPIEAPVPLAPSTQSSYVPRPPTPRTAALFRSWPLLLMFMALVALVYLAIHFAFKQAHSSTQLPGISAR